jgi:hypothetical protein
MNTATWKSIKSPVMQEIRACLKRKAEPGQPTLSRKEANRTWREDILGIFSEEQKRADKTKRQERSNKKKQHYKEVNDE